MSCAQCGFDSEFNSRYCPNCGAASPSESSTSQVQGERRYLTVMFCDLVGSTDLSERLDPEDFGEMVLAYQETGREIVEEHGGHVAHYAGDGLLAFFGYPVAHENDADRAVMSALTILAAMSDLNTSARRLGDVTLQARVGIHAGPTVIGEMGSANRSDISLFGLTPNVAARLEGIAAPGTIVISEMAVRILQKSYVLSDLGTPDLKGITQRLAVSRVHGIALEPLRPAGSDPTTLIGRDTERREVLAAFERSQTDGTRTYLISGEPGVGKSALVRSLGADLAARDHLWLELHCSELASASPLRPVISGLRDLLDIREHDTPEEQLAKLTAGLDDQGAATANFLPYLADLLAIDWPGQSGLDALSGELRRARTLEALLGWAVAAASHSPLVIVAEDLQWADPTTLELLQRIQVRGGDRPILLLGTSRLDVAEHAMFDHTDHIRLSRLSVADSRALAVSLSATHKVPQDTLVKLADRGDGIPLFIEELVRGAAESPTDAGEPGVALPDTLQSLLAARLDRLGESRSVAQAAAVIGREFSLDLLSVVTQASAESLRRSLQELEEAGIVTPPVGPGEGNYIFRHALIQDAAYASLLRRSRRELHAVIASLMPDMHPTVVSTAPELVAHHYEAAGASLMAARWYADAGRRACERAALMEATSHFQSGIGLLQSTDLTQEGEAILLTLLILCANAHMGTSGPGGESTLPLWEQAIALAEELGDTDELTSAMNGLATYEFDRGHLESTIEIATKILEVSESSGSRVAALRGNLSLAMARFYRGETVRALSHCEEGLKLERDGDYFTVTYGVGHDQGTMGRSVLAWSQWWLGRPDAALTTAREGLRRAEDLPSSLSQAMARHMVGFIHYERGDAAEALAASRANVTTTEELNFVFWLGTSLLVRGAQTARLGDASGLVDLDRAFGLLIDGGDRGGGSMAFALFAQAQQALGQHEQAIATAELGLAITEGNGQPFYDPELRRLIAMSRYALDPDRVDDVVSQLSDALGLARRMGAASFALRAATDLANLPGSEGSRRTQAIGELEVALAQMGDGHDTSDQIIARGRLDVLKPTRSLSVPGSERRRTR